MTTKELITANIIQDITKSGNLTYFDDIVTRIYNWLYSLGFEVACIDYTLTDDTYRRVYNHPKYGTLSVKLNRSSVRGDIVNLVNFVTNMEEPPATQPQQITDQPINPPATQPQQITDQPINPLFNFTPISKEDLNQLCSDYANTYKTIGSIYDLLISRGYNPTIPNIDDNSIEFTLHNNMMVDSNGEHTIVIDDNTEFKKLFEFIIIDRLCSNYIDTYSKLFDDNPDNLRKQVAVFAMYHGYHLEGNTKQHAAWRRNNSVKLVPIANINDAQTWAKVTLYHLMFDIQDNSL